MVYRHEVKYCFKKIHNRLIQLRVLRFWLHFAGQVMVFLWHFTNLAYCTFFINWLPHKTSNFDRMVKNVIGDHVLSKTLEWSWNSRIETLTEQHKVPNRVSGQLKKPPTWLSKSILPQYRPFLCRNSKYLENLLTNIILIGGSKKFAYLPVHLKKLSSGNIFGWPKYRFLTINTLLNKMQVCKRKPISNHFLRLYWPGGN